MILIYEERENDTGSRLQLLSLRSTCLKESLCRRGRGCSTCICEVCVYVCGLCERHLSLRVCAWCLLNERKDVFICESCYLYTLSLQVDVGNWDSNLENGFLAGSSWRLEGIWSVVHSCKQFLSTCKELEMIHGGGSGVVFLENPELLHKTMSRWMEASGSSL